jgi:hypothetical protein
VKSLNNGEASMNAYVVIILILSLINLIPLAWVNLLLDINKCDLGKMGITLKE